MKKLISILVMVSLLINIGGYHLVYHVYRAGIKQDIMTYLASHVDSSIGSHLSFKLSGSEVSDPNFQWEDDQKEFRYKGELYDVVSKTEDNGFLRINALKDSRENSLEKELFQLGGQTNHKSASGYATMFKLFSFYCIPEKGINEITSLVPITYGILANPSYPSINSQVIYPPPQS